MHSSPHLSRLADEAAASVTRLASLSLSLDAGDVDVPPGLTPQSTDLRLLELEVLLEREIDELRAENERLGAGGIPPALAVGSVAGSCAGSSAGSSALSRSRAASSVLSVEATGLLAEIERSAAADLTNRIVTRS